MIVIRPFMGNGFDRLGDHVLIDVKNGSHGVHFAMLKLIPLDHFLVDVCLSFPCAHKIMLLLPL